MRQETLLEHRRSERFRRRATIRRAGARAGETRSPRSGPRRSPPRAPRRRSRRSRRPPSRWRSIRRREQLHQEPGQGRRRGDLDDLKEEAAARVRSAISDRGRSTEHHPAMARWRDQGHRESATDVWRAPRAVRTQVNTRNAHAQSVFGRCAKIHRYSCAGTVKQSAVQEHRRENGDPRGRGHQPNYRVNSFTPGQRSSLQEHQNVTRSARFVRSVVVRSDSRGGEHVGGRLRPAGVSSVGG